MQQDFSEIQRGRIFSQNVMQPDRSPHAMEHVPAGQKKRRKTVLCKFMNLIRLSGALPPELNIYSAFKENQLAHFYEPAPGLFIAESLQVIRMAMEAGYEPESFLLEEGTEEKFLCGLRNTENTYVNHIETADRDFQKHNYVNLNASAGNVMSEGLHEKSNPTDYVNIHNKNYVNSTDLNYVNCIPGGARIYTAPHEELVKLTGYELTGGALAAFRRKPLPAPDVILKNAKRAAALECVMNPRNIGSVFRSAAAIGFDAVLLTKGSCDPLYRRAARVSMGTVFQIPWTIADDVRPLKENGFVTVAMALADDSVSMDDPVLKGHEKLAVLMGSERTGLREETIKNADYTAKIPMKHGVDSLNVAAASAVAFWELRG